MSKSKFSSRPDVRDIFCFLAANIEYSPVWDISGIIIEIRILQKATSSDQS